MWSSTEKRPGKTEGGGSLLLAKVAASEEITLSAPSSQSAALRSVRKYISVVDASQSAMLCYHYRSVASESEPAQSSVQPSLPSCEISKPACVVFCKLLLLLLIYVLSCPTDPFCILFLISQAAIVSLPVNSLYSTCVYILYLSGSSSEL